MRSIEAIANSQMLIAMRLEFEDQGLKVFYKYPDGFMRAEEMHVKKDVVKHILTPTEKQEQDNHDDWLPMAKVERG
jgi:hypothetical protein